MLHARSLAPLEKARGFGMTLGGEAGVEVILVSVVPMFAP